MGGSHTLFRNHDLCLFGPAHSSGCVRLTGLAARRIMEALLVSPRGGGRMV